MTDYPFDSDQIHHHRFHGVLSGRLTCINDRLILLTSWGDVALFYPRFRRATVLLRRQERNWENSPDDLLHVYGYPKTDQLGHITSMQMVSFHCDGTEPAEDQNLICHSAAASSRGSSGSAVVFVMPPPMA